MLSERAGLLAGSMEVLFLQARTGSCPLVHDEEWANSCGAGVRSFVDLVVTVVIVETGLIVDDTAGDIVGGGASSGSRKTWSMRKKSWAFARLEYFSLDMSCLHVRRSL